MLFRASLGLALLSAAASCRGGSGAASDAASSGGAMPPPWTRALYPAAVPMEGSDVFILQNLLGHMFSNVTANSVYDNATAAVVSTFKQSERTSALTQTMTSLIYH